MLDLYHYFQLHKKKAAKLFLIYSCIQSKIIATMHENNVLKDSAHCWTRNCCVLNNIFMTALNTEANIEGI